ncbi:MAG: hypothetical protein ACREMV_00740 [Gemmatimonadales bacterium]
MRRATSTLPLALLALACAPAVPPPPPLPSVAGDWAFEAFMQGQGQTVATGTMRFARVDTVYSGILHQDGDVERGMTGVQFTYPRVVFLVETPESVTSVNGILSHADSLAGEWSDTRGNLGTWRATRRPPAPQPAQR